jgi:hypothetical protein
MEIGKEEIKHSNNKFIDLYLRNKNFVLTLVVPLITLLIPIIWVSIDSKKNPMKIINS